MILIARRRVMQLQSPTYVIENIDYTTTGKTQENIIPPVNVVENLGQWLVDCEIETFEDIVPGDGTFTRDDAGGISVIASCNNVNNTTSPYGTSRLRFVDYTSHLPAGRHKRRAVITLPLSQVVSVNDFYFRLLYVKPGVRVYLHHLRVWRICGGGKHLIVFLCCPYKERRAA